MTTITKQFGTKEVVGALVGVELEIEGTRLPTQMPKESAWSVKQDGSLRGGLEYVFRKPLGGVASKAALEEIGEVLKESVLKYSFRTSTHVHVNVSNLKLDQVDAIIALFHLFEDEYLQYCSKTRRSNRFCLSLKDAEGVVDNVRNFFKSRNIPRENSGKYSAMNLCTLGTFGTLEFRSLEGTNDWTRIFSWIRALLALRRAGKELGSLKEVMATDKEELAKLLFPTDLLKDNFLKPGWQQRFDMNRSIGWDAFHIGVK